MRNADGGALDAPLWPIAVAVTVSVIVNCYNAVSESC